MIMNADTRTALPIKVSKATTYSKFLRTELSFSFAWQEIDSCNVDNLGLLLIQPFPYIDRDRYFAVILQVF